MRDVTVNLHVQLDAGEENPLSLPLIEEMDYFFNDTTGKADVISTEITDVELLGSKAKVTVKVLLKMNEETTVQEVVQEFDYSFKDTTETLTNLKTQIVDHDVTDSK